MSFSNNPFINLTTSIHFGCVEDRDTDPRKLGRCKVRVVGLHTEDKTELPTKDLPWAYPMGSLNSAAMNGIGVSPTGPVEGTWCLVVFRDEFKQQPIIIGTIGGIPEEFEDQKVENVSLTPVTSSDGTPVTSSDGTPVVTEQPPEQQKTQTDVKRPSQLKLSAAGKAAIKQHEKLSSLVQGSNKWGSDSTPGNTTIYPYQDSGGVWTIGWGNTTLADGSKVGPDTRITKSQADALFDQKLAEFESQASSKIKVPVTQSMFDATVSMMYNAGAGGVGSSTFMSTLNSGNYEAAAAQIPNTRATVKGQPNAGLTKRRADEQKLFLKDGIPNKDGSAATPTPQENPPPTQTIGQPVDGELQGGKIETVKILTAKGFRDPNEVYPKKDWLNEPDTHRLARHEKIDNTIVLFKDAARVTGVSTALGGSWDQPPIPYNAKYPFNQTRVSESGHVEEWDDTKDNERLHWYHRSGTFEEIDRNGTRVNRIVGDGYEIFERHGHVLIKGHANVTIRGNSLVRVENNAYLQILGDAKTEITGDWSVGVGGDILFHAGGNISMDATNIHLNSGEASGISIPNEEGLMPEFGPLSNPTRLADILANYETPEEGDPSEFNAAQVAAGTLTPADTQPQPPKDPNSPPDPAPPGPKTAPPVTNPGCSGLTDDDLKPGLQLSKHFTLGSINASGSSGIPKPGSVHYGKPATQIVCNQKKLAENVLDPIKAKYPNMTITSAWRSEAVNNSIPGASKTSDHLSGSAADIRLPGFTREQYAQAAADIQKTLPAYNQVILEYKGTGEPWIHVAYVEGANKMESFTADGNTGKKISNGFVVR